ncbi:MAG: metal-dependent transcriptional regulator [Gemmatimonadota bacterium]|jgi:DtxR family Mn-dependent transcriptional regulator
MSTRRRLTPSVEDYLKAVFALSERGEPAATSALAETLDVQPASVSGMVKRLAEADLVEHVPYRGVRLTDVGRGEALRIIRRHRILETYLVERLGYAWEDVHDEAERLEHAASDTLVDRMAAALENPSHDPHGAPIPTSKGEIEEVEFATLAEADRGAAVHIRAVADEDAERLRYLEARGLKPGVLLHVESREPFDGPVTVRVGGNAGPPQVVGAELARRIFVTTSGT